MKSGKGHVLSIPSGRGWLSRRATSDRVYGLERRLAERLLRLLGDPPFGIELWNGEFIGPAHGDTLPRMRLRGRSALIGLLAHPELHFGDAYATGLIEIEGDLVRFLEAAYRHVAQVRGRTSWRFFHRLGRPRSNTLDGSRRNIHHHYDLGNDFYALWLDEEMVYTCAYFAHPGATLEEAQRAKMDHVCRKLRLRPGETVVEAGCGWGALARHMARHYGVKVRAYNISQEQVAYARERAAAEDLADRVEFVLDDYRNIDGHYDAFVSVGMLEHVGTDNYRDLGQTVARCLARDGRGLIHTIGRNKAARMNPWVERRIFPGAYPPTLGEMMAIFEPWSFSVLDVENLRMHYAATLEHWLNRFEEQTDAVRGAHDEYFVRAWRLYLAGSIAAFTTGALQLFQVLFTRPHNNDIPWTRAHLYKGCA